MKNGFKKGKIDMFNSWFYTKPESFMYVIFCLAVILFAAKSLGIIARRLGLPQVVGMCLAGLIIGPAFFANTGWFHGILNPNGEEMQMLHVFSQIGVLFILFSSGLDTNFQEMKRAGKVSTLVACAGVFVPMLLGFAVAMFFMPGGWSSIGNVDYVFNALFIGAILTATSVGITVETLRELGKLNSKVGTVLLSGAIIDDILGIVVLSIITGIKGGDIPVWVTLLKLVLFFVFAIGVGIIMRKIFKWLTIHYPQHRRTGIYAICLCFVYAFVAEQVFGVAAITGAFMAGLMLSGLNDTDYVNKKVIASGYLIFSPVFFAYIGISADFSTFVPMDLVFALVFVVVGILGKIIGCGAAAKACGSDMNESYIVGSGMVARGEVALAVYSTGLAAGLIAPNGIDPMIATICLIIFSSITCPILLKVGFRHYRPDIISNEALEPTVTREGLSYTGEVGSEISNDNSNNNE